jgi:23S rRNA (cytidine1920-2'-O)/16S rRNA (cytidine1409-2'-O)-methyltransferase
LEGLVKQRIDQYLVEQGYFQSREQAQRAIMAGEVFANGKRMEKPSQPVPENAVFEIKSAPGYASRGAYKLEKAVTAFQIPITGRTCLDAGASTGGFTDFLLQNGAAKVYAVDVGYGQLAWKLRQDPRVMVFERENIRYFDAAKLEEKPSLITADLSFISLGLVLAKFCELIASAGELVTLIKPQFEAGRRKVGKKGVVRDRQVHIEVLENLAARGPACGWYLTGLTFSPIKGPERNIEYLGYWRLEPEGDSFSIGDLVDKAWQNL